ncbi:MAG: peptidylprolyl isomerase, partial [Marinirhabdus sp.]|nr:peptidylprolyl isomerase [Marinirhabdus sp.]
MNNVFVALMMLLTSVSFAQDSIATAQETNRMVAVDTVKKSFDRYKVEGVAAVVGDYVVLDSDIDKGYLEFQ